MAGGSRSPDSRYQVRSANRLRRHDDVAAVSLVRIRVLAADAADATAELHAAIAQLSVDTSQRYAAARLGLTPKQLRVIEERGYATPAQARAIAEHLASAGPEPPASPRL